MLVKDVIELAKIRLDNIALSKNDEYLFKIVKLGIADLHDRFNITIKSETINTNPNLSLYVIKDKKISMLLGLYNKEGTELLQSNVIDGKYWDYKIINYKSFILNNPKDDILYAVYKASPDELLDLEDTIELPSVMIEALLVYIAYVINSTITSFSSVNGRGGATEADVLYKRYTDLCSRLDMQGYKIPINTETLSLIVKGYV